YEVRPPGHVDRGVRQRLVHRDEGVAEPADALLVAQRLGQRLPQHDRGVLDGVVPFDLDVALGADVQVEAGVAAQRGQHVVVERDAGVHVDLPGAIEVELDGDVGFAGAALDARTTGLDFGGCHSAPKTWSGAASSVAASWALARRNASFSSASPVVARR